MLQLEWEGDAGSIRINGTEYALKQAHWHSPSEHSINGRRYIYIVHFTYKKYVHLSIYDDSQILKKNNNSLGFMHMGIHIIKKKMNN